MQKCLIIKLLQICKDPIYLEFGRLWSNRFGENGLTDACRAVFSKQAAPKSHAFFSCHEPQPPSMRCGELRGGLSSRMPATATQFRWICNQAQLRIHVPADYKSRRNTEARRSGTKKPARSTEFPLRRLAVRGCERTMRSIDEAQRNLRSGFPYCGSKESHHAGSSRLQICCNRIWPIGYSRPSLRANSMMKSAEPSRPRMDESRQRS